MGSLADGDGPEDLGVERQDRGVRAVQHEPVGRGTGHHLGLLGIGALGLRIHGDHVPILLVLDLDQAVGAQVRQVHDPVLTSLHLVQECHEYLLVAEVLLGGTLLLLLLLVKKKNSGEPT